MEHMKCTLIECKQNAEEKQVKTTLFFLKTVPQVLQNCGKENAEPIRKLKLYSILCVCVYIYFSLISVCLCA